MKRTYSDFSLSFVLPCLKVFIFIFFSLLCGTVRSSGSHLIYFVFFVGSLFLCRQFVVNVELVNRLLGNASIELVCTSTFLFCTPLVLIANRLLESLFACNSL